MDLTVLAIPAFFGSMGYEAHWLKQRAATEGPSPVDYERNDTLASLAMGTGSLFIPLVTHQITKNFEAGRGRWFRPAAAVVAAGALTVAVADAVARAYDQEPGEVRAIDSAEVDGAPTDDPAEPPVQADRRARWARRIAGNAAVTTIAAAGVTAAATWSARTSAQKLFKRRILPDLGGGAVGLGVAIVGWDFIYYWNHRLQHESRIMWAIHVVHHSSERYNLSTALRQPWAESFGMFAPYGVLALLGVRPNLIETARQVNLLYQYWIHTDTIRSIGPLEDVLNTPSHHRVHHGSNRKYLDRNHGSILIIWDRLFGTFQREDYSDPVRYGLTKNINTFNPLRIATHEHAEIIRDVATATNWRDRLSFVLRGPGWAYERHPRRAGGEAPHLDVTAA